METFSLLKTPAKDCWKSFRKASNSFKIYLLQLVTDDFSSVFPWETMHYSIVISSLVPAEEPDKVNIIACLSFIPLCFNFFLFSLMSFITSYMEISLQTSKTLRMILPKLYFTPITHPDEQNQAMQNLDQWRLPSPFTDHFELNFLFP